MIWKNTVNSARVTRIVTVVNSNVKQTRAERAFGCYNERLNSFPYKLQTCIM